MTKYQTNELEGSLLDAAVALAEGFEVLWPAQPENRYRRRLVMDAGGLCPTKGANWYKPSQWWDDGGPIIERERISIYQSDDGSWSAMPRGVRGPTPLVAAMRAFVASKLGEEVELP